MPKVTRWFIKAGILYFMAGVLLASIAGIPWVRSGSLLLPVYWHMLVMGWITQVIMGVSIWLFPRRHRNRKKRESVLSWLAFWMLNVGLIARFVSEPFLPIVQNNTAINTIVFVSSLLQVFAIIAYIIEIWPRLQSREKKKSRL